MSTPENTEIASLKSLPYTAISLSIVARCIFMYLLYQKKSTNNLSLMFCCMNICSSGLWIYYSVQTHDIPMIVRSSSEITLLALSSIYIIRNKIKNIQSQALVLPQ